MDKKGISWVGNMYQKFESMCMEVEEKIYEDTVKYVEGQVQTVGACVKKFYSDVVEDLLPPTSLDPSKAEICSLPSADYPNIGEYEKPKGEMKKTVKVEPKQASQDSLVNVHVRKHLDNGSSWSSPGKLQSGCFDQLEKYLDCEESSQDKYLSSSTSGLPSVGFADVVVYEKPKAEMKKDTIKVELKQANKDSVVDAPAKKHLDNGSSWTCPGKLQRECSDYLEKFLDREECSQDKKLPSTTSGPKTSGLKDLSESHSEQHDENGEVVCCHRSGGALSVAAITRSNFKEVKEREIYDDVSNVSGCPPTDVAGPRLSDLTATDKAGEIHSSGSRMSFSKALSAESEVDVESPKNREVKTIKAANEEISHTDSAVKSDKLFGQETKCDDSDSEGVSKRNQNMKLMESCVMVNKDDCYILHDNQGKQRSYKKKIRDVFSRKKCSKCRTEHEQFAVWCDKENGQALVSAAAATTTCSNSAIKSSVTCDSAEAEWELV